MEGYYVNPDYDNHYRDNRVVSLGQDFASLKALETSISENDDGYLLLSYLNQRRKDKNYSRIMNQTSTILDKKVKLISSNDMSYASDAHSPNRRNNTYNNYYQSRESKHQPPVYQYHEMLSDDSDNEKDDDVSIQTLSLLEKILYERGQAKRRNRNSRFSSPASSNASTPVKKSNNLALSELQEIQFEKVFQLVDKKEQAELADIHTLRSLLRSALDEKIKLASVFADNKQLSEENIAFQLQIANLNHRMLTSKHKAHLPWSFWGVISIRYTYKTSKSF